MNPLTIMRHAAADTADCAQCRKPIPQISGLQLGLPSSSKLVCRNCGKLSAPDLHALLELAEVAKRIGKISQHRRLWIPFEDLLQLARAAEQYFVCATAVEKAAGLPPVR